MNTDILYVYNDKVYLNITNKCPCRCTFCVRNTQEAIGEAQNLWFEHSPNFEQVKAAIDNFDFTGYDEVVFCGYGEPTNEFELLIQTAQYIKKCHKIKTRVNTNGLGNLINDKDITKELCKNIDAVSISMNASDKEKYQELVRSKFGIQSFDKMLEFAKLCKEKLADVQLSVVDVIGEDEVEKCQAIADEIGVKLRVRNFQP